MIVRNRSRRLTSRRLGMIADATSASYMPVAGDDEAKSDVGRYLLAVVSYTDAKRNVDDDRCL